MAEETWGEEPRTDVARLILALRSAGVIREVERSCRGLAANF